MQNLISCSKAMSRIASSGPAPSSRPLPVAETRPRALEQSLLYSEELGIDLSQGSDTVYFRWFLASLLFGARISETIAKNTYRAFLRHDLTSPGRIVGAGWGFLVDPIMREGGYVRYDGRKSTQVLRDCQRLLTDYRGSLRRRRPRCALEAALLTFYGVGPVTANIFLRELHPYWSKANSEPLPIVKSLAKKLKTRSRTLSPQEPHLSQGRSRPDPEATRAVIRRKKWPRLVEGVG
jgi:hypothetical protein